MKQFLIMLPMALFPVTAQVVDAQAVFQAALDEVKEKQSENLGSVVAAVLEATGGDEQAYWRMMQSAADAGHPVALTWLARQTLQQLQVQGLDPETAPQAVKLRARPHKNIALALLEGIDTVEKAQVLRGKMLYVDRKDLKLPKGHYLVQDLIGITIVDADDSSVLYGTLTDVSQTGANAVYHMQTEKGEVLIPAIPDVIIEVNLKKDILRLRPMKGLLDDEI